MLDNKRRVARGRSFSLNCGFDCFYRKQDSDEETNGSHFNFAKRRWVLVLLMLFVFECYVNLVVYYNVLHRNKRRVNDYVDTSTNAPNTTREATIVYYQYPLNNTWEVSMDYNKAYNSSYYWFKAMKDLFKNLGAEETIQFSEDTPNCQLNESSLGPVLVNKTIPTLEWIEKQNGDIKLGGYYAPAHCRATHRVAIIVPYRDRSANLAVFLRYIHPFLKKQLLQYRIFVIEQYGTEQFNKGTLYNIAFLETQRFGTWHCLIFHDVDLIPEDERILYSCLEYPTHMAVSVEAYGYILAYKTLFGGVTSLKPEHYLIVNGYSNFYWSWGAEDDDMYARLRAARLPMLRYNGSIARYATLPHLRNQFGKNRYFFLDYSKLRYRKEGLTSTRYQLIKVTKEKLYTHILADVNPIKMRLDIKSMIRQIVYLFGNSLTYAGEEVADGGGVMHVDEKKNVFVCKFWNTIKVMEILFIKLLGKGLS